MAKKDEKVETLADGTVAVPVTAEDPEVSTEGTDLDAASPSEVSGKRTVKDSDPLPDVDPKAYPERPYAEAVSDEHREFLRRAGVTIERPDGR